MAGTGAANWTVPGGPHTAAASRPCGLRKACNPASTPGTSGRNCRPWRPSTASKLASSNTSSSASHSRTSRSSSPSAAARSRPTASISAEMSVQTTRPPGATARAAVRPGSPSPAATSSAASPGPIPASRTRHRLTARPPSSASSTSTQARQPGAAARHSVRMLALYWAGSKMVVAVIALPLVRGACREDRTALGCAGHRLDQPSSRAARLWWVLTIWSEEALLEGGGGGCGPGGHAQLGKDVLHVPGDGVLAEVQRASDVSVVLPGRDQPQHLYLAVGQHPLRRAPTLEQSGGVARVGGGAEAVEPSPSGVDLDPPALLVAEHPLGRADQQPCGGFLIRQLEFPPAVQRTAELLQRGRWTPRGEMERALGHGRGRTYHHAAEAIRDRYQLARGVAGFVERACRDRDLDLGGQQARTPKAVHRGRRPRGSQRGRCRLHPSLRQPQQRHAGLRIPAQLLGPHERLLCPGQITAAPQDLSNAVGCLCCSLRLVGQQLLVRAAQLGFGFGPRAAQGEHLAAVDAAQALAVRRGRGKRLAPRPGGLGPLAGALQIRQVL